MAKEFDEFQKQAIKIEENAVVSAGAGSGKTTVLSERFAHLVLEKGFEVDEILTLTFTKKATVEMSSRIYKVLKEKAPQKAAVFFKANIKTIDSYCANVAKMGSYLFGISPDFTQNDEELYMQVKAQALPFMLKHRDNPGLKAIVSTKNHEEITENIFVQSILYNSTITEPIDFDKCIQKQKEFVIDSWNKEVSDIVSLIDSLCNLFQEEGDNFSPAFKESLSKVLPTRKFTYAPDVFAEDIENSNTSKIDDFVFFLRDLCEIRKPGRVKGVTQEAKEIFVKIKDEKILNLVPLYNYIANFRLTKEILPLLKEFQDIVNSIKRNTGFLTFADVASLANCILRDYPELRQIEKEKYKAIMIDEFQDNNTRQRDLLFMLAEKLEIRQKGVPAVEDLCKDKLFFVGDEKQSIYKFRGADVSVFRSLSNDFKDGNLQMSTNYRSSPALIASFNTIFGGNPFPLEKYYVAPNSELLPQKDDAVKSEENDNGSTPETKGNKLPAAFFTQADEAQALALGQKIDDFEAIYKNVSMSSEKQEKVRAELNAFEKSNAAEFPKCFSPCIHFALYDNSQEKSLSFMVQEDAEAQWVAQKIKSLIDSGTKPENIAILFRTYSLLSLYERTLLRVGVPYNTETIKNFFGDGPANDLIAFLRICVYAEDSMSYAQVLRSPFVNLSATETNGILIHSKEPFASSAQNILCEESKNRFNHARNFYLELKEFSKTALLTEIITKLWYETGYRYETIWNTTVLLYSKVYDLIFELAHQGDLKNQTLASFVDSLIPYQDENVKLEGINVLYEQSSGVNILGIHKSKGLEFDYVFICGTHKLPKNRTNEQTIFCDNEFGVVINTPATKTFPTDKRNFFFERKKEIELKKEVAELRRLVYVAITRAKKEVFITNGKYKVTGSEKDKEAFKELLPGGTRCPKSFFDVIEPFFNHYALDEELKIKSELAPYVLFDIEMIEALNRFEVLNEISKNNTNDKKNELISSIKEKKLFDFTQVVSTEQVFSRYALPSRLHGEDDESKNAKIEIINNLEDKYKDINRIVFESIPKAKKEDSLTQTEENKAPRFGFNDFGTIAHAYLEAAVNGEEVKKLNKFIVGLENKKDNLNRIKEICSEMAESFINSDLGKRAKESNFCRTEFAFKSRVGNKIVKGTIDLLFQNQDGTYTIVDYKTNQKIDEDFYVNQLSCYRQAVAQILNVTDAKKIKCYLFYLRFEKAVDISDKCDSVSIENLIEQIES